MNRTLNTLSIALVAAGLVACGGEESSTPAPAAEPAAPAATKGEEGKADSSADAVFLDFDFEAKLFTNSSWNAEKQIEDQLLYTIGELNGHRSVGRLDKLRLRDISTEQSDGMTVISYRATLQVAWNKRNAQPETYTFRLPRDVSYQGKQAFTDKYSDDCVDWGAHDVTSGSMWYYYRPERSSCRLDAADIIEATANVSVSEVNTTGKYPEYHRVWEDGVLNVVAVFGKYKDGATSASDAGIAAYNEFHDAVKQQFGAELTVEPSDAPSRPGVDVPEIIYEAPVGADRRIRIVSILVDNVRTAGRDFDDRYGELSTDADLIVYNGHAGLGANIRALARKGEWKTGQYVMVFMNGCDTYAYVDSALFDAHAEVNPDDPTGTKHTDLITNAMPSFFRSMTRATTALIRGLLAYEAPKTYEQIFADIDRSQVVLVSGEEDNTFVPGAEDPDVPDAPEAWPGLSAEGDLARNDVARFETPTLKPGTYTFRMSGSGDADLYVRVGTAPEKDLYDCRPYKAGSVEACEVEISTPTPIHVMVHGYASESAYELVGLPQE